MNGISFPTNCSVGIYMSGNRRLLKVHDGGEGGNPAKPIKMPRNQGLQTATFVACVPNQWANDLRNKDRNVNA